MKRIALTQRITEQSEYNEIRETLDIQWANFIIEAGYYPVILTQSFKEIQFSMGNFDGVIFTGGNDLSSLNYNKLSLMRDKFEKRLLEYCIKNKIPVLGICRGMQFICEYFNCTLKKIDGHVAKRHQLVIKKKSKITEPLSKMYEVNSYHNYGIKTATKELEVIAKTDDGIIEAVCHKKYPIYAIMWHPEREKNFNKNDIKFCNLIFGG